MNRRETVIDLVIRAFFMVAVYSLFASMLPSYQTVNGIAALLDGAVLIGLVAVGIGVTMLAAEFDLSVGSLAAVIGVLAINLIATGMSILPAVVISVAAAGAFGGLQGLLIAATGINSLVFTIGTLIGLRGFALIISDENTVTVPIQRIVDDSTSARWGGEAIHWASVPLTLKSRPMCIASASPSSAKRLLA